MKVFISWSGERSRSLAQALHGWLPLVLHYVKPWLSDADVSAGDRWATVVAKELESSNFGVICVTPENLNSSWMLFEAGALAKSMQGSKVIPLLFSLEFSDVSGPLAQFQAKKCDRDGIDEVVSSINRACEAGAQVPDERKIQLFSALWPELEKQFLAVPHEAPTAKHMRPQHEILEELVSSVRGMDTSFRDLEAKFSGSGPRSRRKWRRFHPMMLEDMMHVSAEDGDDPMSLLMLAGALREDLPWLAEVLVETYREMCKGDPKSSQRAIDRLRRFLKNIRRRDFMLDFMGEDKEAHMLAMEMPMMLDHFLHRFASRRLGGPSSPETDEISADTDETLKS